MTWYENLPDSCPPKGSITPSGESYYRLLESETPSEKDFISHRAKYPDKKFHVSECQAMSISVFKDINSCKTIAKLPKFKDKPAHIARINLQPRDGVIANTPNTKNPDHYSWWRSSKFDIKSVQLADE